VTQRFGANSLVIARLDRAIQSPHEVAEVAERIERRGATECPPARA